MVLQALAQDPYELSLAEMARTLQIPPASLWRILTVLTAHNFVAYDRNRHTYRLGFQFMYLGNVVLEGSHFRSEARDFLRKLADATGETAELDVRIRDQLVLIDQVAGRNAVRLYSRPGGVTPYFHATAPGKVYLAHLPQEKLARVMGKIGLPRLTRFTIDDLGVLERELDRVRQLGYAGDVEEMREGVGRVAAAVFDRKGRIAGCLVIACPAFRIREASTLEKYGRLVKRIAAEMSGRVRGL